MGSKTTNGLGSVSSVSEKMDGTALPVCHSQLSRSFGNYDASSGSQLMTDLLDDRTFRIAVALRLGICTNAPHRCICGGTADARGFHALICGKVSGRISRHGALNVIVKNALSKAGIFSDLEPHGLVFTDNRRPDGMTIEPFKEGKRVLWDVTCVCTMADKHILHSTAKAGGGAAHAESDKMDKYDGAFPNFRFVPLGFETFGSWGPESLKFLEEVGVKQYALTGERRSMEFLRQRVSVEIQRGNGMCVLGTVSDSRHPVF